MIKIAVIDDEIEERERLLGYYQRLKAEVRDELEIRTFVSGDEFLGESEESYDLICLDIDMEGRDGIKTAKEIREKDGQVLIIFVTNMAQMAIRGYEVQALDFVIKPVNYYSFAMKMTNAFNIIRNRKTRNIILTTPGGMQIISTDDLYYVEVAGHYLYYHTNNGVFRQKAPMKEIEDKLAGLSFKRCNNCYLVNLKYVSSVNKDDLQVIDQFKMDLYEDEVFVFTPKGDLMKFPKGATVLDFAYRVHSNIGDHCTGAKINDKVVTFRHILKNGDQVEIMTSANQKPKQEWLNIVKTSRAKAKVRMALKDMMVKDGAYAKEMFERRLKNRKIEFDESTVSHLIKKLGFKEANDFYRRMADGTLDVNDVIDKYEEMLHHDGGNTMQQQQARSAGNFSFENPNEELARSTDDVLVIDRNLKGVDYSLANCCHPIYGDDVFGFVTVSGGIKIHRKDCPNATELRKRFGYRIVKAKWSGKGNSQYSTTLRIIGNDDIGIVNNVTSIISKEEKIMMRSINIDSNDGLFSGNVVVNVEDTSRLEQLIKKLRNVRGVKQVLRL